MSGLGQNIHLLHCASAVHAVGGSGADWGAMMHLQWYWCQSVEVQPRTVKAIEAKRWLHRVETFKTERHNIISQAAEKELTGVIFTQIYTKI